VDRVALAFSLALQVGDPEEKVIGYCQFHHGQSVREGDVLGDILVWRQGGRDKQYIVESTSLAHLFGNPQVRQVDWIESAAEDADAHGMTVGAILVIALGEYEIRPYMIIA
jgi:hypothetical protein